MKICFLCGEYIKKDGGDQSCLLCPQCSVHYCEKCSLNVQSCYTCNTTLQKAAVPHDWTHTAEDIFSRFSVDEKRKNPRKAFMKTIQCIPSLSRESVEKDQSFKGISRDISQTGMCIYSMKPLNSGQKLKVLIRAAHNIPKSATVQWVRKVDDRIYRAGLKFT